MRRINIILMKLFNNYFNPSVSLIRAQRSEARRFRIKFLFSYSNRLSRFGENLQLFRFLPPPPPPSDSTVLV